MPKAKPNKKTFHMRQIYGRMTWWLKFPIYVLAIFFLLCGISFGFARWYFVKHHNEPLQLGATFIPDYAQSFGEDPKQTFNAALQDLQIKHVRLVSYWEDIEPTKGTYDFSQLDWQMKMANQYGAKVSLSIGLRQPRWPECHVPTWVGNQPQSVWLPELKDFMGAVIQRYKNDPALQTYQLENEFFLNNFGECDKYGYERSRLEDEFNFVKQQDPAHPIILSQASNFFGLPTGDPKPDIYGASVYKLLYDQMISKRYLSYPIAPWYFTARAAFVELLSGKETVLHELQAEPWGPTGVKDMSLSEQNKTMNAKILKERVKYGEDTGFRTIDLWGVEYWYWRKQSLHDPSVWDAARQAYHEANAGQH